MEFLVRLEVTVPDSLGQDEWSALLASEAEEGRRRLAAGVLLRIWRIPGAFANYSLYQATDATELHELLASLPLHRWMTAEVTALARHPLEEPAVTSPL